MVPAGRDHGYLVNELRNGLSLVCVDRPPAFLDTDVVVAANREGAESAVHHLIAGGHRRIAYLGDLRTIHTAEERHLGYLSALGAAGIAIDPALVVHDLHSSELAEASTIQVLAAADPPTAIFASQNLVTVGVVRALRALGRQREVALVGFDDVPLADLLEPGLTVVAQDVAEIGRLAAEQLFRRLDGNRDPSVRLVVPTRIIARGSGEIPPTR
jgi:LacI family transcriptional regulator